MSEASIGLDAVTGAVRSAAAFGGRAPMRTAASALLSAAGKAFPVRGYKACVLGLVLPVLFGMTSTAQAQVTLETVTANPATPGNNVVSVVYEPTVTPQTAPLMRNADNPAGNTFTANTPAVTVRFELTNQQFTGFTTTDGFPASTGGNGVVFNSANSGTPLMAGGNLWGSLGGNSNQYTSANNTAAGTGINFGLNAGINLYVSERALALRNVSTASAVHVADLVLTFSAPVDNPVLQLSDVGASSITGGMTTDIQVLGGFPVTRLSGNTPFTLAGDTVRNGTPNPVAVQCPSGTTACGSVLVTGSGIRTLTLRLYERAPTPNAATWQTANVHFGDGFLVGVAIPPPTSHLTVTKISNGGTGTFNFTGGNGIAAHSITTTVNGGAGTAGAVQTLTTAGTATAITEAAPPAGWVLTNIACTVTPPGGTAAAATGTANLGTRTFNLSTADTAAGNNIACTFTNAPPTTITLTKAMGSNRIVNTDQFSVRINRTADGFTFASGTTGGSGSTVTGGVATLNPATVGTQYTLTEQAAAGSTTNLANYDSTITCTDTNGVQTGLPTNAPLGTTVTPVAGAAIACTLTNRTKSFNFVCDANSVYAINTAGNQLLLVNPQTAAATNSGALIPASNYNALAKGPGAGSIVWMYDVNTLEVVRYDGSTQTMTRFAAPANVGAGVQMGALNPATGIYYFTSAFNLYAFNTNTNTYIGQVATFSSSINISAADAAFDSLGNLYIGTGGAGGGLLYRIDAANVPATAGTTTIPGTQIATLPTTGGGYASVAFDATGAIVIGTTGGNVVRVNPTTGAVLTNATNAAASSNDFASCAYPNSLRVQKNLPAGRIAADNQFLLTINTGGSGGNTGTTAGTETGIQNQAATEIAGPILVLDGDTRTFTEAASGTTTLADYAQSWACVDTTSGNAQVANGTGATGTVTLSGSSSQGSNILCTFTNALPPRLTVTKISNGGTGTFGFTGNNGIVAHTIATTAAGGPGTIGAVQALTAAATATAITEDAPPAGWVLTNIACTVTPPGGTAAAATGTADLAGRTFNLSAADTAAGNAIACTFTNNRPPTLTVTKVSNGGTGTFNFTGGNGIAAHSITTAANGGAGTAGAVQTLTTAGTATAITEAAPPAGWALTNIACTVTPPGGTAAAATGTADLANRSFNLSTADTAAGNAIACTFTNNRPTTLTVTKVSNGGTGTFNFTGGNGIAAHSIATTAPGAPGTAGAVQTLTAAGTATAITEAAPPAGWTLTNIACTVTPPGGTAAAATGTADLANRSFNLSTADTAGGNAIACTFTNALQARLTLRKTVARGTAAATAWTLTAAGPTNLSGTHGTAAVTNAAVTPGNYTLAEANGPVGYDAVGPYSCVVNGNPAVVGNAITLAGGDNAVCTITNSRPRLRLMKVLPNGNVANVNDSFDLTVAGNSNGTATSNTVTANANNFGTVTAEIPAIDVGATYTLSEARGANSPSPLTAYDSTYTCTNATAGSATPMPTNQPGTSFTLAPAANDDITCRITNQWRAPVLTITKITQGDNGGGAFNFTVAQGTTTRSQQLTTTAAGAPGVTGAPLTMTDFSSITVTETNAGALGYAVASAFCDVTSSAGATTRFNAAPATPNRVLIASNSVSLSSTIACTFTNSRRPTIQITKISNGGQGTFGFTGTNNFQNYPDITTTADGGAGTTGSVLNLNNIGVATTLTEDTLPANWSLTAIACTVTPPGGTASAATGTVNLATRTFNLSAADTAAGNAIACTFTNQLQSSLQLAKAWAAGSIAGDQVTIGATTGGTNNTASFGATAPTAADSGAAVIVNVGDSITLPAETGANLANYTTTVQCTGGHTLSGTDGQQSNTLTITSGTAAVCTYTNTPRTATLQLAKAWAAGSTAGHQVSIGATTGGTNNTAAFGATAPNAADSGAAVVVTIGDTITLPAEAGTNAANYTTTLACTGGHTLSGTDGQQANTLTITSTNAAVCTYTNTLRTTDLSITKTNTPAAGPSDQADDTVVAGANTTYRVVVTNNATTGVTGAVVRDTPQAGLNCPAGNAVTCSGAACPGTAITVGDLASGVTLGLLAAGATATLEFSCTVQ